ncbi:uncharacterized protein CTHT_0074070 [Thermochaetoides thermophila DSM 1495]|uniref:Uncharacterized protein n=1 Tax=Chaetomium thermophilum (strain DSM 1495 / CBS 144.50 / IMI 039719) TaxID=759272 RepID=G0SI09_CHATD|nr:hypothetical protein CTHT_0074070 [Thermochaetoides thermophila DSM 1495]EGS17079.1 hypothetical protein CTHT_0074070 [Thermochaetoides thermophila DSM 1495]
MRGRDGQMPSRYHRQDTGEQVLACYQDEPKSVTLMVAAPFLPKWSSQLAIAAMDEDEYPVEYCSEAFAGDWMTVDGGCGLGLSAGGHQAIKVLSTPRKGWPSRFSRADFKRPGSMEGGLPRRASTAKTHPPRTANGGAITSLTRAWNAGLVGLAGPGFAGRSSPRAGRPCGTG